MFNKRSRLCFLNHCNQPQLGIPFLKGVNLSCDISGTLNYNYIKVMGCPILCICLMQFTSVISFTLLSTFGFPLCLVNVTPYKWILKEVIGTPHNCVVNTIFDPPLIANIAFCRATLDRLPFFFNICFHARCLVESHCGAYSFDACEFM